MHDELGQFLTALKIDLACLGQGLRGNEEHLFEQVDGMTKKIDNAVQSVRRICSELRPSILEDFGLAAAIEWHMGEFQKTTGIRFTARIDPVFPEVDKGLALVLFRIFQEATTNVVRYAEATAVRVTLKKDDENILLKVADNGRGISKKDLSSPGSLGIIGMRERVRFWNGQLLFKSRPNKGTTMIVSIPLSPAGRESGEVDHAPALPERGAARDRW